jgi:glutamyl-Q tRNA(Asp) synthetase
MSEITYRGRFAPSPSGLLHAGSLATAIGSWLDARAANGRWLIRMEDLDTPRIQAGADEAILRQLSLFGLESDEKVIWQSKSLERYQRALNQLIQNDLSYPCQCSRKDIERALERNGAVRLRHQELIYPGTCRIHPPSRESSPFTAPLAWRAKLPFDTIISEQHLNLEVGDFILRRADGIFSYQLAVVVDDHYQKISHVVRGADLLDNTPRQIWLQQALKFANPHYMHLPIVCNEAHEKLSKQTQAPAVLPKNEKEVMGFLQNVGQHLGLTLPQEAHTSRSEWFKQASKAWAVKNPLKSL